MDQKCHHYTTLCIFKCDYSIDGESRLGAFPLGQCENPCGGKPRPSLAYVGGLYQTHIEKETHATQ